MIACRHLYTTVTVTTVLVLSASTVWAQLPVTDGLMAHWDASSLESITGFGPVKPGGFDPAEGDPIDRWSANGASGIINATGGDMPTYRATGLNGAPGVEFNGETGGTNQLGVGNGITNAADLDIGTNSFTAFVVAKVTDHGVAPSIFFEGRGSGHLGPTFFLEHRNSNQTSDQSSGKTLAAQVNTPNGVAGYNSPAESSSQDPFPLDLEDGTTRIHVTVFDRNDDGDGTGAYFGVNAPATFQGVKDDGVTSSIPLGNGDSDGTFQIGFGQGQSLPGTIGDIVLYNRELSNAEQIQLGYFLASKYGIGFLGQPAPEPTLGPWIADASGDWNASGNWTSGAIPNGENALAVFGNAITATRTVFSDSTVSVRDIQFVNANSYIVAGGGSVDLFKGTAPGASNATIHTSEGSHQFQLEVNLRDNTTADISSGSTLEFVNRLHLNGNTLTKTGDGTLMVNSSFNTGGGTIINNGGVTGGGGTVGGSLDNVGGTVAPGNSAGVLTINGNYTQGSAATLAIEVEGTGAGSGHDQLAVNGSASLDGTLDIQTASEFTPGVGEAPGVIGDSYIIITADSLSGEFSTVNGRHAGSGIFYNLEYNETNVSLGAFQAQVGDSDGDLDVDITDFNVLSSNFDPAGNNPAPDWTGADFDLDGDVDITDFNGLSANFSPNGYGTNIGQVPEPTSCMLAVLAMLTAVGLLRRRSR